MKDRPPTTRAKILSVVTGVAVLLGCTSAGRAPGPSPPPDGEDGDPAARVSAWLDAHRDRPPLVRAFAQRLPKGGDLHSHLGGSVYAESYIAWAAAEGLCVDPATAVFSPPPCSPEAGTVPAADILHDGARHGAVVDGLSTRGVTAAELPAHDRFFATFGKFRDVGHVGDRLAHLGDRLAEVADRAAGEHVLYLELMLYTAPPAITEAGAELALGDDLAAAHQRLVEAGLREHVAAARQSLNAIEARAAQTLQCSGGRPRPGCSVVRRYQQVSLRTVEPGLVFAQLAFAFELAHTDPRVVGVNLAAPEDYPVALRDYPLHMEMLAFLSRVYPDVKVALHAGELRLGLVPPEHLRSHIRDAVAIAGARRIGHAVALAFENEPFALLQTMKDRGVAVEICLSSNAVILGVEGMEHPFPEYLAAGVPTVLASDDMGVLRTDFSHEFARAISTYRLDYRQLENLVRASLEYSFLDGDSLWQDTSPFAVVDACAGEVLGGADPSARCAPFLAASERAALQWRLEAELAAFETMAWLAGF